ncbi:MAG: MlaA family lipoprotein [Nitrospiraceae bacterium]
MYRERLAMIRLACATLAITGLAACTTVSEDPPTPLFQEMPAIPSFLTVDQRDAIVAQSVPAKDLRQDDNFDPFSKPEDNVYEEEYDPWESFNYTMFEFNRKVDRYALKPVAEAYNVVLPDLVQVSISNFFNHIRYPPRFFNNVFQGKFKGAGVETGRFLINTTFGLAGFFDIAKDLNWVTPEEDTGQTLGVYGVKPGPYLILPFLPPFTVRDAIGYVGDIALNPINWLVFPIIEVDGIPSVVAHKNRTTTSIVQIGGRVGEIVNERSLNLEKFQGVEEATLDLYSAVRNAYLQKRARQIRE